MLEAGGQKTNHAHVHLVGISLELALEGCWHFEVEGSQVLVGATGKIRRCFKFWRWIALSVGGWFADFCHDWY